MKVAIVYDRINKWGGAERLLLSLQKIFPDADIFTSVLNLEKAPWAKKFKKLNSSFIQTLPLSYYHQLYASLMPIAFESFSFDKYDLVISVTSESAKGIITKPGTKHICICLTPTRYLWSGYEDYFKNPIINFFSKPVVSYLRTWDKIASSRPDLYFAISKEVQGRIKRYYDRDSKVIYPPVSLVQNLKLKAQNNQRENLARKGAGSAYFLIVSRLVPYKRVDLAIKACNKLKLPLKIIGEGSQTFFLKLIAGPTVEFLGQVQDSELCSYYKNCNALIFPGMEDFGLVMAEAQSFGKPVVAFRGGGALEIIKEGETGEFFSEQSVESLINLLEKWDNKRYNSSLCIENARRFSYDNFKQKFLKSITLNKS